MSCPQIYFTTGPAQEGIEMLQVGSIEHFPVFLIGKSINRPQILNTPQQDSEDFTRRFLQDV